MINISDINKYSLMINIISIIILNSYELKNIFRKDNELDNDNSIIKKIEGLRDFSKILYDLVTLNIISLLSNTIPKYGLIIRCIKKVKNQIKNMKC